ncbi:hypothetical protein ACT4UT_05655 [Bacillus sp. B-TM1]
MEKTGEGSLRELVLDGILEMKWNGAFLSGADAHPFICESTLSVSAMDPLAKLSIAALTYAQNLEINEAASLSARLYFPLPSLLRCSSVGSFAMFSIFSWSSTLSNACFSSAFSKEKSSGVSMMRLATKMLIPQLVWPVHLEHEVHVVQPLHLEHAPQPRGSMT